MCGILGYTGPPTTDVESRIRAALSSLDHRGPDSRAVVNLPASGCVCIMGHTRLRIIDLSPGADQPLSNEDRTVWVTYNGEIYNHRELRDELARSGHVFRTNTDTEVLVHLYEECSGELQRMLRRLRGMFAFALFDSRRRRIVLARDRFGIKPMYWAGAGGGIAFSSEARSLVRAKFVAAAADPVGIQSYLLWGHLSGSRTAFEGVHSLAAGSYLDWIDGDFTVERWWDLAVEIHDGDQVADQADLSSALDDAVARHLVADRPVGIFLSGGIDSGVVATLARRHGSARALTVTFPEAGGDEGNEAGAVAKRLEMKHDTVPVTGDDVATALPDILSAMDQPTSDGVNTWLVSKAASEAGLVVALSGLGGDELFGGYPSFRLVPKAKRLMRIIDHIPWKPRASAARAFARIAPGGRFARLVGGRAGYEGAYLAVRGLFSPAELSQGEASCIYDAGGFSRLTCPADMVTLLETSIYMNGQLLRDTDQMSMSHSLEVRVPILDDEVTRVALALRPALRTAAGKTVLAAAAGIAEPPRKRPFALPFDTWIRGPLYEPVREAMLSDELPLGDLVDSRFRHRLWSAFEDGRVHWSRPWSIAILRMWLAANGLRM